MRECYDTNIPWLGEIPAGWKFTKLGRLTCIVTDGTHQTPNYVESGFPFLSIKDISSGKIDFSDVKYISEKEHISLYQHAPVKRGDFLFTRIGTLGVFVEVNTDDIFDFFVSVGMFRLKKNVVHHHFLLHYLNSPAVGNYIQAIKAGFGTAAPKYNLEDVKRTWIIIPTEQEQKKIADYLDTKCAEIDDLSADIQSEIDTLEAYKRAKVFDVVMHGVNHKEFIQTDSDVWSTIPACWKIVDIKYLFEIVKRIAGKEGYDIIAITQQGLKYKDISSNEGQLASDYSGYQFVYPGDFAMNHMDLLTGWVDLSDKFGVTSPDYRVFRIRYPECYDRKYYKYIMQCCYMNRIFYSLGQGVSNLGRWRLQTSVFENFKVPVPPYEEQVMIGNYLDDEISAINGIIAQKQEQLAVLAEYKKSVIYEYVTGKKEVPAE